jgi:hypothetical protein
LLLHVNLLGLALTMYTSTAIFLDLARLFLKLMVMVQVLGNVVVSFLLPISDFLDVSKPVGDPLLNDVGSHVDSQLGLGVLLPVVTAFTFWSFSAVSTSTSSKRLMVGADLGD